MQKLTLDDWSEADEQRFMRRKNRLQKTMFKERAERDEAEEQILASMYNLDLEVNLCF